MWRNKSKTKKEATHWTPNPTNKHRKRRWGRENRLPPEKPHINSGSEENRDESDIQSAAAARGESKAKEKTAEKENAIIATMENYLKEFCRVPKEPQATNSWTHHKQKGRKNETHRTKPRKK